MSDLKDDGAAWLKMIESICGKIDDTNSKSAVGRYVDSACVGEKLIELMSDRVPDFKSTKAIYPEIEIQIHRYKQPFKDGVNKDEFDEVTLRASALVDGIPFYEQYVMNLRINPAPIDMIKNKLEIRLINRIDALKQKPKCNHTPKSYGRMIQCDICGEILSSF